MESESDVREKLIKRLRYLWMFELFDSLFLPALVILEARILGRTLSPFTLGSIALVAVLLWQGAAYWRLKLRAVKSGSRLKREPLRWFGALKYVNWALIGLLPSLLVAQGARGPVFRSGLDVVAGLGMYALALLEQVNYYYYQLMYDYAPDWRYLMDNRRLKRSSLSRALEKVRRERARGI
jgi:hypothetical protein